MRKTVSRRNIKNQQAKKLLHVNLSKYFCDDKSFNKISQLCNFKEVRQEISKLENFVVECEYDSSIKDLLIIALNAGEFSGLEPKVLKVNIEKLDPILGKIFPKIHKYCQSYDVNMTRGRVAELLKYCLCQFKFGVKKLHDNAASKKNTTSKMTRRRIKRQKNQTKTTVRVRKSKTNFNSFPKITSVEINNAVSKKNTANKMTRRRIQNQIQNIVSIQKSQTKLSSVPQVYSTDKNNMLFQTKIVYQGVKNIFTLTEIKKTLLDESMLLKLSLGVINKNQLIGKLDNFLKANPELCCSSSSTVKNEFVYLLVMLTENNPIFGNYTKRIYKEKEASSNRLKNLSLLKNNMEYYSTCVLIDASRTVPVAPLLLLHFMARLYIDYAICAIHQLETTGAKLPSAENYSGYLALNTTVYPAKTNKFIDIINLNSRQATDDYIQQASIKSFQFILQRVSRALDQAIEKNNTESIAEQKVLLNNLSTRIKKELANRTEKSDLLEEIKVLHKRIDDYANSYSPVAP